MKNQIINLLFFFCLTTSFQCEEKCKPSDVRLDHSRSWFPLKGKTQLRFVDESNNVTNFRISVLDTLETTVLYCDAVRTYESINATLFLTPGNNDQVIVFRLNPPNTLTVDAYTIGLPFFSVKNVFNSANQGVHAKRFFNYTVGNRNYAEVILLLQNPKTSCPIDSIILANNVGIVGFNNYAKKYTLQ
jgi:hypothetical protein